LYIVQSGWLKGLIVSPRGREQIIHLLGPGDTFNEHGALLKDGCNLVTVQAIEASSPVYYLKRWINLIQVVKRPKQGYNSFMCDKSHILNHAHGVCFNINLE
jgi:hypothetical protein